MLMRGYDMKLCYVLGLLIMVVLFGFFVNVV